MVLAKELRQAILQAALQGKLTKQLETDSSVDEMLITIQEEKEKLVTDKMIKKEKQLPETQDEEIPFDIPENWRWVRLGNIGTLTRGNGIKRNEVTENGFPCIRYGELYTTYKTEFNIVISHTSKEIFDKSQKVNKNDILMALTGENNFDIALALAYVGEETVAMGGDLTKWSNHQMHPLYLVYVMNSAYAIHKKSELAKGDIIVHISNDKLATILLPIPPIEEQQRIVDKINEIMPKIDEYEKIEKELEALKKEFPTNMKEALLQAAMQGKLTEQLESDSSVDNLLEEIKKEKEELIAQKKIKKEKPLPDIEEEIPFDIPENWRWVRLKNIVYNGGQKIPDKCFSYIDIGSIDNIHQKLNNEDNIIEADKAPSRARKIVNYGDVLYATVRPYLHNMCIIDRDFKEEPIASTGFAVMTCCKGILNKFLLFYMLSPEFDRYANSTENAKGMAYPAINDDKFYRALIPLAPLEEQQRIVERLDALLPLCEDLEERIDVMK